MGYRLSQLEPNQGYGANFVRPGNALLGVGAFREDPQTIIEETPLASSYSGPAGVSEHLFRLPLGLKLKDNIASALRKQDNVLRFEVGVDTSGWFTDQYRVKVWTAGEVEEGQGESTPQEILAAAKGATSGVGVVPILAAIPLAVLIKLLFILGATVIVGVIIWKINRTTWGAPLVAAAMGVPLLLPLAGLAVGLLLLTRSGRSMGRG